MKTKRILSMLLASMMVMSMATVSAFAEDPGEHECDNAGATCTTPGTCSICSAPGTRDLSNHDWQYFERVDATCTEDGYTEYRECSDCGYTVGKNPIPAEHTWNGGEQTTAPTCSETGVTTYTCTADDCGATITEDIAIDPNAHNYGDWTSNGDGTHTRTCSHNNAHTETGDCDQNGANNGCSACGYGTTSSEPVGCDHKGTPRIYESNGDGTHDVICYECGETIEENANCVYGDDNVCDDCGYEKSTSSGGSSSSSSSSGSSGSSSSSSSSTTTKPAVDTKAETDKIAKAEEGSKVSVKIEGTTVPADYIKTAMESKATVVVDYGSYAWEISDVKTAKAVDLSINTSARYLVEQGALKALKGDNSNVIDIAHDGKLGFKGTLKYNVDKKNAGKFVNLYYYNSTTKKLELQGSTKIGADGNVLLPFTHCSTYVLNITDKAASAELFEDFSAGESATVVEDTLPAATNAPAATEAPATTDAAANPETGNSAAALMAIPMAIAAAAIISKKR